MLVKRSGPAMHVDTTRRTYTAADGTVHQYRRALLRRSFRDESGRACKETLANLSELPDAAIEAVKKILAGGVLVEAGSDVTVERSLPHGDVAAVDAMASRLGIKKLLGPASRQRDLVYALIVSRVVRPRSKLSTLAWWSDTTLGGDLGVADAATDESLLTGDLAAIRLEMDTHFFGTLAVTRAFAPQLAAHGSGAVLNILSALSWLSIPRSGAYCAAKSAEWSLTNALRLELAPQGTRVTALHVAYMDTDMTRHLDVPKSDPAAIAKLAIDGIAAGDAEIIADETSRRVLAGLSAGVAGLYPQVA